MPETVIEQRPAPLKRGSDGKIHPSDWGPPEPLTTEPMDRVAAADKMAAENQRLWDAMTPEEQAAELAAHDQVMRNIDERQRRSRGITDVAAPSHA